ncbi:MAG: hypothetical protein ACFBSD_06275 [Paracoccaceae bacterium]
MDGYLILGWGSLIWDLDDLAPHVEGAWAMGAGPRLPMEFSRISAKRKGSLVVCLDPKDGVKCPTHAIRSRRGGLAAAVEDLARRERAPAKMIGGVCLATGTAQGRPKIVGAVRAWCRKTGAAGAVWTDLRPNFAEERGMPFQIAAGVAHMRALTGESFEEGVRYIASAPAETDTPLRRALGAEAWWQQAVAARGLG